MTEEARITGLFTEDPILGPEMMASRPNVIATRTIGKRHEVFFHENPAHSNVPAGRELRALLNAVEIEEYVPPVQGEGDAQGSGVQSDVEAEDGAQEEGEKGRSSRSSRAKSSGNRSGRKA